MTITIPDEFERLTNDAGEAERTKRSVNDDQLMTFEDYLVRSEWERRIGTPRIEDDQRLEDIMRFLREATRQGSIDLPEELEVRKKLTRSGVIMGTPQYMAPEQASGCIGEVGMSSDIYSLGAIMYDTLTGRPPFTGEMFTVINNVINRAPVSPRQRRDSIDPGLEAICMKCLEKTVERRYHNMGNLAEDLQRFMSGAEVSALQEASQSNLFVVPTGDSDDNAKTSTWVRTGTTESGQSRTKSWWQFWR